MKILEQVIEKDNQTEFIYSDGSKKIFTQSKDGIMSSMEDIPAPKVPKPRKNIDVNKILQNYLDPTGFIDNWDTEASSLTLDIPDDFKISEPKKQKQLVCECGAHSCGHNDHARWCELFSSDDVS